MPEPQNILAVLPDGVIGIDSEQNIAFVNPATERIFGYARAEILGRPLDLLLPPACRVGHRHLARRFIESQDKARLMHERQSVMGLRQQGTTLPAEVTPLKGKADQPLTFAIVRDVSLEQQRQADLKDSEQRLHDALREAQASVEAKKVFLANMTQELRTPLNAIIGFAELVEREIHGPHSNPSYREYGKLIRASGEHLLSIVNDLLDLSSLEMGKAQVHEEAVLVSEVVTECEQMLAPILERSGLRLEREVPADLKIRSDRRAFKQMLLNLIANAIKYTGSGGCVAVTATIEKEQPVIAVKDTGGGIEPERLQHITEPFGTGEDRYRRRNGGTGIGLSITKSLIERHGGHIEIASVLGAGKIVRLWFPAYSAISAQEATGS